MLNKIKKIKAKSPTLKFNKPNLKLLKFSKNENNKSIDEDTNTFLKKITNKVKVDDIKLVGNKIGNFNKGALTDVWDKVLQLWEVCKTDERTWKEKTVAIGALVYVITTVDVIPDVIPGLGFVDDVGAIMTAIASLGLLEVNNVSNIKLQKDNISFQDIELKIKVLISAMSRCANSDYYLSKKERKKIDEIIEFYIFSDEGLVSKQLLKDLNITKCSIEDLIIEYFNNPIKTNEIIDHLKLNCMRKEDFYSYVYMVAYADGKISSKERNFLDKLCENLAINDQSMIENSIENSM